MVEVRWMGINSVKRVNGSGRYTVKNTKANWLAQRGANIGDIFNADLIEETIKKDNVAPQMNMATRLQKIRKI